MRYFGFKLLGVLGIELLGGLGDYGLILGDTAELTTPAQQQGLLDTILQMAMR
jgi:hypothetical protein